MDDTADQSDHSELGMLLAASARTRSVMPLAGHQELDSVAFRNFGVRVEHGLVPYVENIGHIILDVPTH